MTAENVITIPTSRSPLITEMHDALDTALTTAEADSQRKRFYVGLALGYGVAFGIIDRQTLDRARNQPWSSNIHFDFRRPRPFDEDETLWACGVRHGYALGTSERSDADDCAMCGERLTEDDDYDQCLDGKFCPLGCFRDWHANGPHSCDDENNINFEGDE